MVPVRTVSVALLVALAASLALAQDKDKKDDKGKPDDKNPPKLKGFLPANFKKLGLSAAQVQKVYAVQAEYKDKLDALEKQKSKLKAEEKEAVEKVLTPDQLKELNRIRTGEKDK